MISRLHTNFLTIILIYLVLLSGCRSTEKYSKTYYILNANRQTEPTRKPTDCILELSLFTIDSSFSGSSLVYRVGETKYESDFYNRFLASPSSMVTDTIRNWLSTSELFGRVLDPGSQIDPTHIIEGHITALYGDYRDRSSPKAIIEMRVFLLKANIGKEPLPVFGKTYQSSIGFQSNDPEDLVEALGRCLQEILSTLENDLSERLSRET